MLFSRDPFLRQFNFVTHVKEILLVYVRLPLKPASYDSFGLVSDRAPFAFFSRVIALLFLHTWYEIYKPNTTITHSVHVH